MNEISFEIWLTIHFPAAIYKNHFKIQKPFCVLFHGGPTDTVVDGPA
jgi:hypothetical protein